MKLGHGSEIAYTGTTNTLVTFTLVLEGQPTLTITCDTADTTRTIHVGSATHPGLTMATKGRFEMKDKLTEDSEGMPLGVETRVDSHSVYRYVIGRLPLLLGRLLRLPCPDCELNHH